MVIIRDIKLIIKLIKRDLILTYKNILIKNFLSVMFISLITYLTININRVYDISTSKLIFIILKGVEYVDNDRGVELPVLWFMINSLIIYYLGYYFCDDISKGGKYIFIRIKNKSHFYISKVLWIIFNTFIYYSLLFLTMVTCSNIFGVKAKAITVIKDISLNSNELIIGIFILYFTTSVSLILLQNSISLIIKPVYSYILIIILIFISVFSNINILPGQHSLILRHAPFDSIHNLKYTTSIFYNLVLSTFSVVLGYYFFKKKDIM